MSAILNQLFAQILANSTLSNEQIYTIIENFGGLKKDIFELLKKIAIETTPGFKVIVDYSKSLKEMIEAGKYDQYSYLKRIGFTVPKIPGVSKVPVDILLAKLDPAMTIVKAAEFITSFGYRAATLPELLALGEQYPEEHCKWTVVSAGSNILDYEGNMGAVCLGCYSQGRELSICASSFTNIGGARLLVVRDPK
jgi:hypothetical protein